MALVAVTVGAIIIRFTLQEYRRDRIPILIYHRVVADELIDRCAPNAYVVSATRFREQMQLLRDQGFTTIDLDDFLLCKDQPDRLPRKPVIITFDDGYENNYLLAYPVLKQLGFKAVIYSVSDPDAEFFRDFEIPERLLAPEQIKELSANGIAIQGHTRSHRHLKYLADDEIEEELAVCKATLEGITGRPVVHMAIPFGSHDRRLFGIARATGYQTLAVPGKGTNNLATDPFRLRRLSVHRKMTDTQFMRLVRSPAFAVVSRMYAAAHLSIRRTLGQGVETKVKRLFARLRLDNAESFAVLFIVAMAVLAVLLYLALS
jgi:peptidoglycan/xylan/chitin deacetylase (PgdA/CDA1 family)